MEKASTQENIMEVAISRMHSALSAFYIWKWLEQSRNLNNEGGEEVVRKNLEIMNTYKYVFNQIIISTYKSFIIDLSIFFDRDKFEDNFSIKKLLASLREGLSEKEIERIEKEIELIRAENGKTISFIQELRNSDVAHQALNPESKKIIFSEIEKLFNGVQKILNFVSQYQNKSSWVWDHIEKDVSWHMKWIFENLERGEKMRLNEVYKEYNNL